MRDLLSSKLIKGSLIIFLGNIIFRIGGYIYRFLMILLLETRAYGIFALVTPLQGIFQILSASGLPPAIAKYISEYNALDEKILARQTVYTSLKIMIFLGVFFGLIMVFFVAPYLSINVYHKPETLLPFQIVGLITPFSVIVGAFRGAFQGVYKMEYILITRAIEQIFMILTAVFLIIIGLSVVGAVLGSVIGFAMAALASIIIFKKYMWKYLPKPEKKYKFSLKDEIKLSKKLISFSFPVTITALAEMCIYSACTFVMGIFLSTDLIAYFGAADPIARLPLIISISIATTMLPASSEAFATKNKKLIEKYVNSSYRYGLLITVPLCVGIAILSEPIMKFIFFKAEYVLGSSALSILVLGMGFYAIFAISASIVQGIGKPKVPMYILILGAILTIILSWMLIPTYGIEGGALGTTIATLIIGILMLIITSKITKVKINIKPHLKIIVSSVIMAVPIIFIPKNLIGLIISTMLAPIIYCISLLLLKGYEQEDITLLKKITKKIKIIQKPADKIYKFILKNGI